MCQNNYSICPPPHDQGEEPLFRVVYVIDVGAADERAAAETAWKMMRAEDALAPVLVVIDHKGRQTTLDLSDDKYQPMAPLPQRKLTLPRSEEINLAKLIYDSYPHADLLPIDPMIDCRDLESLHAKVTSTPIGDGLFTFLIVELIEGSEGTLDGAIRVTEQARNDIQAVLDALYEVREATKGNSTKNPSLCPLAAELLEACKSLTSYTAELLYQLDDQIQLDDIDAIRQAQAAIDKATTPQ